MISRMGKTKKRNMRPTPGPQKQALEEQIMEGKVAKNKDRNKIRIKAEEELFVDARSSKKILDAARKQQAEVNFADMFGPTPAEASAMRPHRKLGGDDSDDDEELPAGGADVTEQDFYDDVPINAEDERAFEMFRNQSAPQQPNLKDLIMEKIALKRGELQSQLSDNDLMKLDDEIDPRVRQMYEGVRDVMKRYRSGKVPKAFKVIPKLKNWEQILFITEPLLWTAAAMFKATRIFSSALSPHMAQRFYNLVLLPRIRDDLAEYKKLNTYLYASLKKALFKPSAFFKGIILPLVESGDCTLREAIIFGSVVARNHIPVLHSSACLLMILEMEYSGANSIFIRILLDKRYALPYRVVDAAVFHFLAFERDKREMPVLWHQSLLTFTQHYKNDITTEQRDALMNLLKKQVHPKLTPEIRRELLAAHCKDVEQTAPAGVDEPMQEQLEYDPVFDKAIDMDSD